MADTNINAVTSRAAAGGDFALVSGQSGVGPARVLLTETGAAALNAADSAALRVAADAASSAQGLLAASAVQPSVLMPRSPVGSLTLGRFRAAIAKTIAGVSDTRILCIGDSTMSGVRNPLDSTRIPTSWPNRFASILNKQKPFGLEFYASSLHGDKAMSPLDQADSRVTYTGTIGLTGSFTCGGKMLIQSSASTITFTPTEAFNTAKITCTGTNGVATLTCGGNSTAVTPTSTTLVYEYTVTAPSVAVQPVTLTWTSGTIFTCAIQCTDSTKKAVYVLNCGHSGATSATFNATTPVYSALPIATQKLLPHLTIINLCINDWRQALGTAQLVTNLTAICSALSAAGSDILFVTPVIDNGTSGDAAIQQTYVDTVKSFATSNGYGLIDTRLQWQSFSAMNALGFYDDAVHLTSTGYADFARMVAAGLFMSV